MYQIHLDIFTKVHLYILIARQFKDNIQEIYVYNEIEEHFGKKYCRIYVEIRLKENATSEKRWELQETIGEKFYRSFQKEYFSFHLTTERRDNDDSLYNREEELHYDYIWNLLAWFLSGDSILVKPERFKCEKYLYEEHKESLKKFEEKRQLIEAAVRPLTLLIGDWVAIESYGANSLRLGSVKMVNADKKSGYFSMTLTELKNDLKLGRKEILYVSKSDIYAIIKPDMLVNKLSKTGLVELLKKDISFSGLHWRRPQVLWYLKE